MKRQHQPQLVLLDTTEAWESEWVGMPEYSNDDLSPWRSLIVNFESLADVERFEDAIGQKITPRAKSVWFPQQEIGRYADKRYAVPE